MHEYAKRAADPLPAVRIGRHRRFYRSELERWLAQQRSWRLTSDGDRLPFTKPLRRSFSRKAAALGA